MGVRVASLHRAVPVPARLDVWPFVAAQTVNLALLASGAQTAGGSNDAGSTHGVMLWGFSLPLLHVALVPVLAVLQLLTWLGTHWSVKFRAVVTM